MKGNSGVHPCRAHLLGGRSTVGLQILDLRIGVRIPASQPISELIFFDYEKLMVLSVLRRVSFSTRIARSCLLTAALLILHTALPSAMFADWKATGPFGGDVEVVRVVPKVPGLVIAAARNGLMFTSSNAGASWKNIPFPAEFAGVLHALQVDPRESGTWYAGMEGERPAASGVYKTTDAGRTWTLLPGTAGKAIWSLALWPGNPDVVAAGAADGVYRSNDAGATWSRISPADNLDLRPVVSLTFHPRTRA